MKRNSTVLVSVILASLILSLGALISSCGSGATGGGGGGGGGTPSNPFVADVYVSVTGSDEAPDGDGSFAKPYRTIQKGLNEAETREVVGVLAGVYTEEVTWPMTYEGVTLRGVSNTTAILHGKGTGPCLTIDDLDKDQMITIESIMITGGLNSGGDGGGIRFAEDSNIVLHLKDLNIYKNTAANGGGLYLKYVTDDVIVENCAFTSNEAISNGDGGGIHQAPDSDMIIMGSTFQYNKAGYGGAIESVSAGRVIIGSCNISNNTATIYGAGVCLMDPVAFPYIVGCTIEGNVCSAGSGGGIYNYGSNVTVESCLLQNNSAVGGGGVFADSASSGIAFFKKSVFINNQASGAGAGISTNNPTLVDKCLFVSNAAAGNGGAINISSTASTEMVNCIFRRNSGYDGGTISYSHSSNTMKLFNCTFVTNEASDYGASIHMNDGTGVDIVNCIFWNNYSPNYDISYGGGNYNLKYSSYTSGQVMAATETACTNTVPTFDNYPTDLHLSSSCTTEITKGGTIEGAPDDDFDDLFTRTEPYSMGAYEENN